MRNWPPAWLQLLTQRALYPLFDWSCVGCGGPATDAPCAGCQGRLEPLPARRCPGCQGHLGAQGCRLCRRDPPFRDVRVLGRYAGVLRQVVRHLKYHGRPDLGLWGGRELARALGPQPGWVVVPMPVSWRRRQERGYNQVEPIAWALSRVLELEYCPRGLDRVRHSSPSYSRGRSARWDEALQAFRASRQLAGARVWLIDDVVTSGATVWGAAAALREAGVAEVRVGALGRTFARSSPQ